MLPTEIHEQILSYLPFIDLIPLRRVSNLWNLIILHLLSRTKHNVYLQSWTLTLSTSSGQTLSIPLNLESTRPAETWQDIYHRPYIFSGPVTDVTRSDHAQVLKLEFWDTKQGTHILPRDKNCRLRCCGLADFTIWPWSTLPISRHGPLGEVITWRDLYRIDLWESNWDKNVLRQRMVSQQIGGHVNIFMGAPVQMTEAGFIAVQGVVRDSFAPNRIRVALSYSAICGFLVLQRRREQEGSALRDKLFSTVGDPMMRELAISSVVGCGCKLMDWEGENLGIKVIRLHEAEGSSFERFR